MKHTTRRDLILAVALVASAISVQAQNAYIQNLSLPRFTKAGVNYPISLWARNANSIPYTNFSISWRLDGGATNTGPNQGVGGGGIAGNNYLAYTHPVALNATQGTHTLEVWITTAVDSDMTNNLVTISFTALNSWADKVVLLEARTETWCQYCPPSNTLTNSLMTNPDFALGKFHLSDALDDCPECITYYNQHNITYTPAGIIEMGEYGGYAISSQYGGWEDAMTARAAGVSPVELTMTSSVNNTTRVITVTLNAEFTYAVTGTYALRVYVAEDGVAGPQTNAPSNYIHNHVMRAMLGGVAGTLGVVPNTPVVGTNYSQTYSYTVPAGFNIANLQLIGVLEHNLGGFNNRYAINAVKGSASGVGIADLRLGDGSLQAYPNPFVNDLYVSMADITGNARMDIYTLDGRLVHQDNLVLGSMVASHLDLGAAGLSNGAYLLRITTEKGTAEQRIVKVD